MVDERTLHEMVTGAWLSLDCWDGEHALCRASGHQAMQCECGCHVDALGSVTLTA
jgi:hypothetical protein